jgi:nondiscriminating aspartyl-tRNA synthetase
MERVRSIEVARHVGGRVRIAGWLRTRRALGGVTFAVVRDGWGEVQAVWEGTDPLAGALAESIVEFVGDVVAAPTAPLGVELRGAECRVLEAVTEPTPIALGGRALRVSLPVVLDTAVVANRHPTRRAVFALAADVMAAFRACLDAQGFTEIQTPKIVGSSTEGGANVFAVDYFGRAAFLAQSPQFYKQVMVGVFERVYEVGPVFRAEPHDTTRHANEFVSLDVELGFIRGHRDVMAVLRDVLAAIFERLASRRAAELALLGASLPEVPAAIPSIDFLAAKSLCAASLGSSVIGEPDLSPDEERLLGAWAQAEHGSVFLFVTGYPLAKRPFYTAPDPERPGQSNGFDLLFRGLELVTGGQRLHRYEDYLAALAGRGLAAEPFGWYLDAFRYGMPPHGGFAIGLERLLMQLLGLTNVRLATLFPRDLHRLVP